MIINSKTIFAGIYEEPINATTLTEGDKKFVDSVPIDAEEINRKFNRQYISDYPYLCE